MMVHPVLPRPDRRDVSKPGTGRSQRPAAARSTGSPSRWLTLSEPVRSLLDVQQMLVSLPWLMSARRGDRHTVIVLPGLMTSDDSTQVLRSYLQLLGYRVHGWSLGRNVGPTRAVTHDLPEAVARIAQESGGRVSLVGWSLGGIYARNLAHRRPAQIRQVITLGSPYRAAGSRLPAALARRNRSAAPLTVPSTSIYSRQDGVVSWRHCIEPAGPRSENIRVRASHFGLGFDPYTLWAIADRLAQPADSWRPFKAPLPLRLCYPVADAE